MDEMSGLEAVLSAIGKYSWRAMFGVFIATGVLLFFACQLGIYDWVQSYRGLLIFGFVVSGGVLLSYLGSGVYPWVASYAADTRRIHLGKKHLQTMNEDEKVVCRWFIEHRGQSYRTDPANGTVATLLLKDVLFRPGAPYPGGLYDYQMQRWAFEYQSKHQELFKAQQA